MLNSFYRILGPLFWKENARGAAMAAEACVLLFGEVERLSQVNWHDVGMHAAL